MYPPAIFLMGPTASGKTELAVRLAKELPCEIISVDSAMVYRGMDIGTAKPDRQTLDDVPHRLIDICDPGAAYSAAQFRDDALVQMAQIQANGKTPLLVGGTFLYFRALEQGLSPLPSADESVRLKLVEEAQTVGWDGMHARLARIDPAAAGRIHPNDPQRVQRALEVFEITGETLTALQGAHDKGVLPYRVCKIVVAPASRPVIHQRIYRRFQSMLQAGFVDEVRSLYRRGDLHRDLPSMRAVGYRQVWQYLAGNVDYPVMVDAAIAATRQFAKRQMTWLRSEQNDAWYDALDPRLPDLVLKKLSDTTIY